MKKGLILAFVAVATSLALFAGIANKNSSENELTKTACCDQTECCPSNAENCE